MSRADIEGRMSLNTSAVTRGLQKAKKNVTSFVSSSMRSFGALAGVAGLGALSRGAINLGSQISDLAIQLRIGTTELQVLQYAAQEAGVSSETLERALRNVQLRTQDALNGNKRYAEALQRLGLNVQKFAQLSTDKKFEAIAIAQSKAKDSAQAFRDVAIILGERAGPQLQEVLQSIAKEGFGSLEKAAKDAGQVMEDETIKKLDKASDEISKFKKMLTILSGEILAVAVPAFKKLGESIGTITGELFFQGKTSKRSKIEDEIALRKKAIEQLKQEGAIRKKVPMFSFSKKARELNLKENELIEKRLELLKKEQAQKQSIQKETIKAGINKPTSKNTGTAIQQNIAPEVSLAATAPNADADPTASTASKKTKRTPQKATWRASNIVGNIGRWESRFGPAPTFEERERAAGLYLRGNDPMGGRRAIKVGGERAASPSNDGQKQSAEYLKNINRVIEKLEQGLTA